MFKSFDRGDDDDLAPAMKKKTEIKKDEKLPIKIMNGNSLRLGEDLDHVDVTFNRTIRIPEDGKDYPLPPSLGLYNIHDVEEYVGKVPEEWLEHKGIFFCMFQCEACYINFANRGDPHALKIGIGMVNSINGKPWRDQLIKNSSDYIVTPDQPWLDGIASGKGTIKQFVAMPLGEGLTVEAQVTGKEEFGGVQVICYQTKEASKRDNTSKKVSRPMFSGNRGFRGRGRGSFRGIGRGRGRGFGSGHGRGGGGGGGGRGGGMPLPPPRPGGGGLPPAKSSGSGRGGGGLPPPPARASNSRMLPPPAPSSGGLKLKKKSPSPSRGGRKDLMSQIDRGKDNVKKFKLRKVTRGEMRRPKSPKSLALDYIGDPSGGRGGGSGGGFLGAAASATPPREMGMGVGGSMKQVVYKDKYGFDRWNQKKCARVFVHIVNSAMYRMITGITPQRTVNRNTYQMYGYTWYDWYNEGIEDGIGGSSKDLKSVKGVKELLSQKMMEEEDALVLYDFEASDGEEMSVEEGEIVKILKDVGEWLFVQKHLNGDEGYIPASYVEKKGKSSSSSSTCVKNNIPLVTYPVEDYSEYQEESETADWEVKEVKTPKDWGGDTKKLLVLYDYDAVVEDELTIRVGETIHLICKDPSGWWLAENRSGSGRKGLIPGNYVEEM